MGSLVAAYIAAGLGGITLNPDKLDSRTKLLLNLGSGIQINLSRHIHSIFEIRDYVSFFKYPEDFHINYDIMIYEPDFRTIQHHLGIHIGLIYTF